MKNYYEGQTLVGLLGFFESHIYEECFDYKHGTYTCVSQGNYKNLLYFWEEFKK